MVFYQRGHATIASHGEGAVPAFLVRSFCIASCRGRLIGRLAAGGEGKGQKAKGKRQQAKSEAQVILHDHVSPSNLNLLTITKTRNRRPYWKFCVQKRHTKTMLRILLLQLALACASARASKPIASGARG